MASEHAIRLLKTSSSASEQLTALRTLKNQIIGHLDRKESFVRHGLIEALSKVLDACIGARPANNGQSTNGSGSSQPKASSVLDDVHLQALILVSSLAQAGLAFAAPLKAASIEDLLVSSINPKDNSTKISVAALKATLALCRADRLNETFSDAFNDQDDDIWHSIPAIQAYRRVLTNTVTSASERNQVALVCQILNVSTKTDKQREALCNAGILDCLAVHINSFYHQERGDARATKAGNALFGSSPTSASHKVFVEVLGAVTQLVRGSRHRVGQLLLSPPVFTVLPFYQSQVSIECRIHSSGQLATYDTTPNEFSVPWIHNGSVKTDSGFQKAFPLLGTSQANPKSQPFIDFAESDRSSTSSGAVDSKLVSWLIHLMRTHNGLMRVRAAALLSWIVEESYISQRKSYTLALTVVPLLIDVIKSHNMSTGSSDVDPFSDQQCLALLEAPRVLAQLLKETPFLGQTLLKHANDAGVLKEACQYLKRTFAPLQNKAPPWIANPDQDSMEQDRSAACTLGDRFFSIRIAYLFLCREAGLGLVATVASSRPGDDKYRKALVDQGAISCIMDSLNEFTLESRSILQSYSGKEKLDASVGNPLPVILAACNAATAMARSIFLLRTSLIDSNIAKPIVPLIQHPNIDIRVGALTVTCNLLVECSPIRTDIIDAGAIDILIRYAHSNERRIQNMALWAMKHLVSKAPGDVKQQCLERLGLDWLMKIIEGTLPTASPGNTGTSTARATPNLSISAVSNAMGERVSILRTPDDDEKMQDESAEPSPTFDDENEQQGVALSAGKPRASSYGILFKQPMEPAHEQFLEGIKDEEWAERNFQPLAQDLDFQAHAMDIIRNAICGENQFEMIDLVLNTIGSTRLYQSLTAKLQANRERPVTKRLPTKILESTLKTICHIAAGTPKHRAALINQRDLMRALIPIFKDWDDGVRSTCCWICMNLMWVDDTSDQERAKQRAMTLKDMGIDAILNDLCKAPREGGTETCQDVRERAGQARECMISATEARGSLSGRHDPQGLGYVGGLEGRAR